MPFDITEDITLIQAVNKVSVLVGFPTTIDAVGNTDPASKQLIEAVNEAGRELLGFYDWQVMSRDYSQVVDAADIVPPANYAEYDLPEDFLRFVDETQWNETSRLPGLGPVNPQDWKRLEVRVAEHIMHITWRVWGGKLQVRNPGSTPQTFVYSYISKAWVRDADDATLFKNEATKNADILLLDDFLLVRLARAKWREYKGFDSSNAMRDFLNAAESRFGKEKGAPTLSLVHRWGYKYLDYWNIPDTGYGSGGA